MQIPLNALRSFEAVARLGSFSAAAKELYVTQSAVSHQVRHLESCLGVALFDRRGRRPILMPRGNELARRLTLSLREISAACEEAQIKPGPKPLVIAAIPSVAIIWLIPRLAQFRAMRPDLDIQIVYALHGQDIDFTNFDVAIIFAPNPPKYPNARAEIFLPGTSVPVCNRAIFESFGTPRPSPKQILEADLLHDTDQSNWEQWRELSGRGLPTTETGLVFQDINLLRAAVLAGQGVAMLPVALITEDLEAGRLVRLSDVTVREDHSYYILTREMPDGFPRPAVQSFYDWVMSVN